MLNTAVPIPEIRKEFGVTSRLATVNATKIAREMLGRPITNTTMIGALIKATGLVKLESLIGPLEHRFGKEGAKKNIEAMKKAYEETQIDG